MKPTTYEDINKLLDLLTKGLVDILGDNLVGLYLTGSLTYGDFDHSSSDIDFLAVLKKELSEQQLVEVRNLHNRVGKAVPFWAKRLEGSYIPQVWLSSTERPEGQRPYVNGGSVNLHPYGNEWLLNLDVLYECGIALAGLDPRRLLKPVNISDVREASKKNLLEEWQPKIKEPIPFQHADYDSSHLQAYAILTMCRILHRAKNDVVASKKAASKWAKEKFPQWKNLVQQAEDWKHGIELNEEKEIVKFIRFVVSEVRRK